VGEDIRDKGRVAQGLHYKDQYLYQCGKRNFVRAQQAIKRWAKPAGTYAFSI
jgi:hypothetical protein